MIDNVNIPVKSLLIQIHQDNDYIMGVTGISLNCLLLCLIIKKSRKHFEMYRYILLYTCILQLFMSMMILINGQYVEIDERHFFLISSGLTKYNSYQLNVVLTLMYTTSTSLLIFSTPIPFLYRYSIIVSNKGWGFRQFFIAITINILSTLPENIFGAFALIFPESEFQYRTRFLDKRVWHNTKTDAWRMFVMTEKENKWYLATLGYIVLMVPIIYSIVLYCCIKIKLKISKVNATNRLVTIQKNSYNSQIDAVLLCQAIIPLIFALLPYFFWTLCIIFKADFLKTFSPLMWMHVSWIPTVECLATIFLVKDFRNGIFTFWRKEIYPEFTKMNPAGKLATRNSSRIDLRLPVDV